MSLIKHRRLDIDKIYLYIKDPFQSKYQLLINRKEKVGIEILKNPKGFIDYSQSINDVYENWEDYDPTKKRSVNSFWSYDCRYGILFKRKKLSIFYVTIIFQSAQNYKTKCSILPWKFITKENFNKYIK